VALIDLSTGEFTTAEYRGPAGVQALADEIGVLRPREVVLAADSAVLKTFPEISRLQLPVTSTEGWSFEPEAARRTLLDQLKTHGLEGFGLDGHVAAVQAAGGLLAYLRDTQKVDLAHVRTISYKAAADCLVIDPITLKHLEVVVGSEGSAQGSLLNEIDRTVTSMAGTPAARLAATAAAIARPHSRSARRRRGARVPLHRSRQVQGNAEERAGPRAPRRAHALGTAGPRDLVSLRQSLGAIPRVRLVLEAVQAPLLRSLVAELDDLPDVRDLIERTLIDEPPAFARDGGFTRDGIDPELDNLKHISRSGRQVIADMEERERARTGINSLKVRFNRVFGYYIEISKSNLHAVPDDYNRKQTVAGGERFTTPALKEYEEKVLGADARILERELEIFDALLNQVAAEAPRIQDSARALATLDVLAGLAETSAVANFTKPHVHDGDEYLATDARHPVVERFATDPFVPNDIDLNGGNRQLIILTGPNMGGKSTYLRQTALIPLAGADRIVCAGARREGADRGSDLCARGRLRQHRARASPRSWWRCRRPPTSSTPRPRRAWSCSTRSAAAPPRSTASASRGRWPSTSPPTRRRVQRPFCHALSRADRPGRLAAGRRRTRTSPRASGRTRSFFFARSFPDDPTAATASRWRSSRASRNGHQPRQGYPSWARARRARTWRPADAFRARRGRSHRAAWPFRCAER
jgi:DNA mismatch repair protein MutS